MATKGWTHPKHKYVAAIGLLVSVAATTLDVLNVTYVPWFVSKRQRGVSAADKAGYTFIAASVDCSNDFCMKRTPMSDWQTASLYLMLVAAGSCALSLVVQLILFWPLVLTGRVYNGLLRVPRILDFYGAPLKFAIAFIYISHSGKINNNYSWTKENTALLQLESIGIGILLISYILQVLVFVALTVAVDAAPIGEVTYLETMQIEEEERQAELEEICSNKSRRSSYAPDTVKDHDRILVSVKYNNEQQDSFGTVL